MNSRQGATPPRGRAAALVAVASLATTLASCSRQPAPVKPANATAPAPPTPALPLPQPTLGRADLIGAARSAADAYAGGRAYPQDLVDLVGRRVSIRLPFGCDGQAAAAAVGAYEIDPKKNTLTLTVRPQVWTAAPWIAKILAGTPALDSVEGFWISRPWTTSELCPPPSALPPSGPAPSATAEPPATAKPAASSRAAGASKPAKPAPPEVAPWPSPETLGVVRIFHTGDSRLKRHTRRPYQVVLKLSDSRIPQDHRFWLVLEGRVVDLHDAQGKGQPVACYSDDAYRRPVCLIALDVDHVALEAMGAGEVLADWPG
jgi:hypothetical protein